jgi:hypothetical protein
MTLEAGPTTQIHRSAHDRHEGLGLVLEINSNNKILLVENISHVHGAHIKSDSLILNPAILGRSEDMWLFVKNLSHGGEVFFLSYMNSVGSKIDR